MQCPSPALPTSSTPFYPLPILALSIPRDSQSQHGLPQGAPKPGELESAARNLLNAPQDWRGTRERHTAHVPNAGSLVSRYTSFPPPSTTQLRHNTGLGKFRKPRESAPTVAYAFAPNLAEPRRDRCLCSAAPGAVRAARARAAGGGRRARAGWAGKGAARRGGGAGGRVAGSGRRREARRVVDVLHLHAA